MLGMRVKELGNYRKAGNCEGGKGERSRTRRGEAEKGCLDEGEGEVIDSLDVLGIYI